MKKQILIIGTGANAYALAKKLSEENNVFTAPLSPSMSEFTTNLDIRETSVTELLEFAMENQIDITVPFSEASVSADISTIFSKNNLLVFAPTARSAEICSNKCQAKKIFYKLHIPTPKFGIFEKENIALDYIKNQEPPFVIKNSDSNSAAILTSENTAKKIINSAFIEKNKKIIIEEYVYGTPFSYYAITDGYKALPIGSSINYRHSLDGEGGQLTSGMGACVPNYKLSINDEYFLMDNVTYPLLEYLERSGSPYMGIIGIDGIKNPNGDIYILGLRSFFQDSDTSGILENLDEDIIKLFESCIIGSFSDEKDVIRQKSQYAVSLVLHCKTKSNTENPIKGLEHLDENTNVTFFENIKKNKYLEYEIINGTAIVLTSTAPTVSSASKKVYEEAQNIDFTGKTYRKDICQLKS